MIPDISELRRLRQEATEGPWCIDDYVVNPGDSPGEFHIYQSEEDDPPLFSSGLGTKEDAAFIAAAANHWAEMCDEIERYEAEHIAFSNCSDELNDLLGAYKLDCLLEDLSGLEKVRQLAKAYLDLRDENKRLTALCEEGLALAKEGDTLIQQRLEIEQMVSESSYRAGYIDALSNYAVWNNGVQYVGVLRRPLTEVIAEFSQQQIPVRY